MTDQTQANTKVEVNQPSSKPSEKQKTSQSSSDDQALKEGTSQRQDGSDLKLPDGAKQRTAEQFKKLKQQLADERGKRIEAEKLISNQYNPVTKTSQSPDYYNPETGVVDVHKLNQRLTAAEQRAISAERRSKNFQASEDRKQELDAYKAYPELNPRATNFNEDFHNAVVGMLSNAYAKGKTPTVKSIAKKIKSFSSSDTAKAKEEGAVQAMKQVNQKDQAALEATGRSDRRTQVGNLNDLRKRSNHNDMSAIAERLGRMSK